MWYLMNKGHSEEADKIIKDLLKWKAAFQFYFDASRAINLQDQNLMTPAALKLLRIVTTSVPLAPCMTQMQ